MILCVYDLDDTLVHNSARVRLSRSDGTSRRFQTALEYREYSLKDGESFDYVEYEDPALFEHNTDLLPFFDFAKDRSLYPDRYRSIVLTARKHIPGDEVVPQFLSRHGLTIPNHRYYASGGIHGNPCVAKPAFLKAYLRISAERGVMFKDVHVYDDRPDVLQAIKSAIPVTNPVLVENLHTYSFRLKPIL